MLHITNGADSLIESEVVMEIGNKVKVVYLESIDKEDTNLQIGNTGTIVNKLEFDGFVSQEMVLDIDFGKGFIGTGINVNIDGSYNMYPRQLEVITD